MSAVVKGIIGVVLLVVSIEFPALGPLAGKFLFSAGVGLLVTAAASLFLKADHRAPIAGISINYTGTLEPRRLIYGALRSTESGCEDCMGQVLAAVDAEARQLAM